jgi:ATP-dependent DNA helicase RecG
MKFTQDQLKALLIKFKKIPKETEWLEFKKAEHSFSFEELGKYFSALSNEARLQGKDAGWLVLGVEDESRAICGTSFKKTGGLDELKHDISQQTTGNISFIEIYELFLPEGRVLMFHIPPAPQGLPIAWKRHYYGRDGESIVGLSLQEIEAIRGNVHDWSEDICEDATMADLDVKAIDFARVEFGKKYPALSEEMKGWSDKVFLDKAKLTIKGKLTKTAILLLGNPEATHFISPVIGRMTWIVKDSTGKDLDYEHFDPPFLLASQKLRTKIRNLKYRYMPDQTLFPEELLKYDPWVIREALHNCIAHQDYDLRGKIVVVENPDELIFTNMGSFLPGSVENVIEEDAPPKRYRNPFLVTAMANLNMIDTIGSGIKRMFLTQRDRFFPMPTFELKSDEVTVRILGKILDPAYTRLLRERNDIHLNDIILLDYIQKKIRVTKEAHYHLKKQRLVEGRFPNLHLSSDVHKHLDDKAGYIKKRGFEKAYYEKLIIEYLNKFGKSSRKEIDDLLMDKLPDVYSVTQKKNKIRNLLYEMSRVKGVIENSSDSTKNPVWVLSK